MRQIAIASLRVVVLALCACSSTSSSNSAGATAEAGTVSALSVSPNPVAVTAGSSKQLSAEATMANGSKTDISADPATTWTSNNPQTATVDAQGVVVGVSAGVTSVNASFAGATTSVTVTVVP